ncbi:hypothetical protein PYW07_010345 [Mythimna separata]|uniref:Uncharacterized protein n=1 Tax=Mythimna separata TaxID=271217 RepID=A0AAD7YAF5_MYTSE|nr:hypothetical protein PYW07_010345 [Mythimna separata]
MDIIEHALDVAEGDVDVKQYPWVGILFYSYSYRTLSVQMDIIEHALDVAEGDVDVKQYPWVGILFYSYSYRTLSVQMDIIEHALDVAEGDVDVKQYPWVGILFYSYCEYKPSTVSLADVRDPLAQMSLAHGGQLRLLAATLAFLALRFLTTGFGRGGCTGHFFLTSELLLLAHGFLEFLLVNLSSGVHTSPLPLGAIDGIEGDSRSVTTVVLIQKEFVIAAAADIGPMPKHNFRKNTRVLLGESWERPGRRVRNYVLHPEYGETYNTVALVQLSSPVRDTTIKPVCPPPDVLRNPVFYVIKMKEDIDNLEKEVIDVMHIPGKMCREFYISANLYSRKMRPPYVACAVSVKADGVCVWGAGSALVSRDVWGRWQLVSTCRGLVTSDGVT